MHVCHPKTIRFIVCRFIVHTAQHIDIAPSSFLSCKFYWNVSARLQCIVHLRKRARAVCVCRCWLSMSSPITSIMIICAHWPNKPSIGSCRSCNASTERHTKKSTAIARGQLQLMRQQLMAQRIPNNKCHYHVLVQLKTHFCDGFYRAIVSYIFARLSTTSFAIHFESTTIYSIYFWPLTLLTCSPSHLRSSPSPSCCQLLIFDLLFGLFSKNHKNYLSIVRLCENGIFLLTLEYRKYMDG